MYTVIVKNKNISGIYSNISGKKMFNYNSRHIIFIFSHIIVILITCFLYIYSNDDMMHAYLYLTKIEFGTFRTENGTKPEYIIISHLQ